MSDKIRNHYSKDSYVIILGHTMPIPGYEYVEDDNCYEVSKDLFIAMYKIYIRDKLNDEDLDDYNTFSGYNYSFDPEFGYFEEEDEDEQNDFEKSLTEDDIKLTATEKKVLIKFLKSNASDISGSEEEAYMGFNDEDYKDPDIEEAIEDESFVVCLKTIED